MPSDDSASTSTISGLNIYDDVEDLRCDAIALHSDFRYVSDVVAEEMLREAVRREADPDMKMVAYTLASLASGRLCVQHRCPQPFRFYLELAQRLLLSCGVRLQGVHLHPLTGPMMQVILPYLRCEEASPERKAELCKHSKTAYDQFRRTIPHFDDDLRRCELIAFDDLMADLTRDL